MLEVKIFLDEDDRYEDKPAHEHLMHYLMHHKIIGASLFTASMGFGHKHHLHIPKRIGAFDEGPIMILFIDEEEKTRAVLPHIREVVKEGLIIIHKVEKI